MKHFGKWKQDQAFTITTTSIHETLCVQHTSSKSIAYTLGQLYEIFQNEYKVALQNYLNIQKWITSYS